MIEDIFDSISKIKSYVKSLSFDDFNLDPKTIDAVNFEIIGEAANKIPEEIKNTNPELNGRKLSV